MAEKNISRHSLAVAHGVVIMLLRSKERQLVALTRQIEEVRMDIMSRPFGGLPPEELTGSADANQRR
jgi:hypothetical protein